MIILADSGGSKTDWIVLKGGKTLHSIRTIGMNPYFTSSRAMEETLKERLLPVIDAENVSQIFFYGSGCFSDKNKIIVKQQLGLFFNTAKIEVQDDMLGACRALFNTEKGIAGILGTGSNSCIYDGTKVIEKIFSTGYIFGDEGSGAYLGKKFITALFKNKVPEEIRRAFYDNYKYSFEDILSSVYINQHPNRFLASFAIFLKQHVSNRFISDMVEESFMDYFREQVVCYKSFNELPFAFTGAVGYNFIEQINTAALKFGIVIKKYVPSPLNGLIEYHTDISN